MKLYTATDTIPGNINFEKTVNQYDANEIVNLAVDTIKNKREIQISISEMYGLCRWVEGNRTYHVNNQFIDNVCVAAEKAGIKIKASQDSMSTPLIGPEGQPSKIYLSKL